METLNQSSLTYLLFTFFPLFSPWFLSFPSTSSLPLLLNINVSCTLSLPFIALQSRQRLTSKYIAAINCSEVLQLTRCLQLCDQLTLLWKVRWIFWKSFRKMTPGLIEEWVVAGQVLGVGKDSLEHSSGWFMCIPNLFQPYAVYVWGWKLLVYSFPNNVFFSLLWQRSNSNLRLSF